MTSFILFQVFYNTARYYHAYYGHKTVSFFGCSTSIIYTNLSCLLKNGFGDATKLTNRFVISILVGSQSCLGGPSIGYFSNAISKPVDKVHTGTGIYITKECSFNALSNMKLLP